MTPEIIINDDLTISDNLLQISAIRSSGPGGQNVNKVATCIELRFKPEECEALSNLVVQRLLKLAGRKVDSENTIIITSQKYREQYKNLEDACKKLKDLVLKAMIQPKVRRPTKPSKASVENRIQTKNRLAFKKRQRSKKDWHNTDD